MHFFSVMKMNFTMFFLFFAFFDSFLQIADCQTCNSKNPIGNCATLSCPSKCQKRLCTQEIKKGHDTSTLTAAITVPIFVLLLLVTAVFVTIKCVRSPQGRERGSLKSENSSVRNHYFFGRRQSPHVPGPPKIMPPFPPIPTDDNEYEDIYEYEYCETENIRGEDNPIKITAEGEVSTDGDYLTPNPPLGKPNFPPPHVPDSPTKTTP